MSDETEELYLPKKAVAKRYGSSTRSVDRWEQDGTLPPGFYIKKRKFWRLGDLVRRERCLVSGANAIGTTMEAADATS